MTIYYVVKETLEIIGTHKDWLALRESNPERFKELSNTRKIELVRIGTSYPVSNSDDIKHYRLWEKHVEEVVKIEKELNELKQDVTLHVNTLSCTSLELLQHRLKDIQEYYNYIIKAYNTGSLNVCGFAEYTNDPY